MKLNLILFAALILILTFLITFTIIPVCIFDSEDEISESVIDKDKLIGEQENKWVDEKKKIRGIDMAYKYKGKWWFENKKGEKCRL